MFGIVICTIKTFIPNTRIILNGSAQLGFYCDFVYAKLAIQGISFSSLRRKTVCKIFVHFRPRHVQSYLYFHEYKHESFYRVLKRF